MVKSPKEIYFYSLPLNEAYYAQYIFDGLAKNEVNTHQQPKLNSDFYGGLCNYIKSAQVDFILFMGFSFMNHIRNQFLMGGSFLPVDTYTPFAVLFYDDPRRYIDDLLKMDSLCQDISLPYIFFVCDSVLVDKLREYGLNAHYLPCCYNPGIQFPRDIEMQFRHNISFAGTVISDDSHIARRKGLSVFEIGWLNAFGQKRTPGIYSDYIEWIGKHTPNSSSRTHLQQCYLMEQKHALRMEIFDALAPLEVNVYGQGDFDPEKSDRAKNVIFHNRNLHQHKELPFLYSNSKISLSVELLPASVHQRIFECIACGGFPLFEKKADNAKCFEGFVEWENLDDLREKVEYYLDNDEERNRISDRLRRQAYDLHRSDIRVNQMLDIIGKEI